MQIIETSWRWRRIAVFFTLISSVGMLAYLAVFGKDTSLARDIVQILGLIIMTIVTGYMGFATWDSRNQMIHGRASPQQDVQPPPQPAPPPSPAQPYQR